MQSSRPFEGGSSTGETECKQFHCNIDTAESPQVLRIGFIGQYLIMNWPTVGQHMTDLWPTIMCLARCVSLEDSMDLEQIVENFAMSLTVVDEMTEIQRESRSGSGAYIPCVGTMWEDDFTREAVITWALRSPDDFQNFTEKWFEVSYPTGRENVILYCLVKVSNLNSD